MQNVKLTVKGNILTIEVDLSQTFGASASGKSITIASTKGNAQVPGTKGIKVGLNVYSPVGVAA